MKSCTGDRFARGYIRLLHRFRYVILILWVAGAVVGGWMGFVEFLNSTTDAFQAPHDSPSQVAVRHQEQLFHHREKEEDNDKNNVKMYTDRISVLLEIEFSASSTKSPSSTTCPLSWTDYSLTNSFTFPLISEFISRLQKSLKSEIKKNLSPSSSSQSSSSSSSFPNSTIEIADYVNYREDLHADIFASQFIAPNGGRAVLVPVVFRYADNNFNHEHDVSKNFVNFLHKEVTETLTSSLLSNGTAIQEVLSQSSAAVYCTSSDYNNFKMRALATSMSLMAQEAVKAGTSAMTRTDAIVIPVGLLVCSLSVKSLRLLLIPLLSIGLTLLLSFSLCYAIHHSFGFSFSVAVPSLAQCLAVSLSIDYSIFALSRYIEEIALGNRGASGVLKMMKSAGKTIFVSACVFILSFLCLVFFNNQLLRSYAVGSAITILFALLISVNLVPTILLTFPSFFQESAKQLKDTYAYQKLQSCFGCSSSSSSSSPCCSCCPSSSSCCCCSNDEDEDDNNHNDQARYLNNNNNNNREEAGEEEEYHDRILAGEDDGDEEDEDHNNSNDGGGDNFPQISGVQQRPKNQQQQQQQQQQQVPYPSSVASSSGTAKSMSTVSGASHQSPIKGSSQQRHAMATGGFTFGGGQNNNNINATSPRFDPNADYTPPSLRSSGLAWKRMSRDAEHDDVIASSIFRWFSPFLHWPCNVIALLLIFALVGVCGWQAYESFGITDSMLDYLPAGSPQHQTWKVMERQFGFARVMPLSIMFSLNPKDKHNSDNNITSLFQNEETFELSQQVLEHLMTATNPPTDLKKAMSVIYLNGTRTSLTDVQTCLLNVHSCLNPNLAVLVGSNTVNINRTAMIVRVEPPVDPVGAHGLSYYQSLLSAETWRPASSSSSSSSSEKRRTGKVQVQTFGGGPSSMDALHEIYSQFPKIAIAVSVIILLIVGISFKSIIVPLRSIITIGATQAFVFGVLSMVYIKGDLSNLHDPALADAHALSWLSPIVIAAVTLGIAVDYEMFILFRVAEYIRSDGAPCEKAVLLGLCKTGAVISSCGIVLAISFGGMMASQIRILIEMAAGLLLATIFDTFIVRTLLSPILTAICGKYAFWPSDIHNKAAEKAQSLLPDALAQTESDLYHGAAGNRYVTSSSSSNMHNPSAANFTQDSLAPSSSSNIGGGGTISPGGRSPRESVNFSRQRLTALGHATS